MIKVVFCDVDGVLTNGGYIVSEDGLLSKVFNTKDFVGLQRLAYLGVMIVFVSGAQDECIDRKAEMLEWKNMFRLHSNLTNKLKFVKQIYAEDFSQDEMAFIGDDLNDLELLEYVGIAACPADSSKEVLELINKKRDGFIMSKNGGDGAVREFSDMIWTFNKNNHIIKKEEKLNVSSVE